MTTTSELIFNRLYIIEPSLFLREHLAEQIARFGRLNVAKDFTAFANELFFTDGIEHLEGYRYLALNTEQAFELSNALHQYVMAHITPERVQLMQNEHLALLRHVCFELLGQRSVYPAVAMFDVRDAASVAHASALVY